MRKLFMVGLGVMMWGAMGDARAEEAGASDKRVKANPPKSAAAVTTTYAELSDLTTVATQPFNLTVGERTITVQASYTYEGKTPRRPETVELRLITTNPTWVWGVMDGTLYLDAGEVSVKGPSELGSISRPVDGVVRVTETLTCDIPLVMFALAFSQKEVKLRLTGEHATTGEKLREVFPLDAAHMAPFKALLKSVPRAPKESGQAAAKQTDSRT